MFKGMFGGKTTTKTNVILAMASALVAIVNASDTYRKYKQDQEKENKK